MTLPRPQRELLLQLVFRWPHPCFVVRSRYGHYALVVSAMSRSRPLERMDRGYSSETVDGLATAGLVTLTWVGEVPAFGFRRPFDGVHGSRIEVTPSGRAAINAVSEAQQRRAQAISEARVRDAVAISEARAARVARGEVPGDARPVHPASVDPVLAELQGAHGVGGDFGWAAFLPTARDYLGSEPSEPTSDTLLTILDVLCAVTEQAKRRGLPLMVVARGDDQR